MESVFSIIPTDFIVNPTGIASDQVDIVANPTDFIVNLSVFNVNPTGIVADPIVFILNITVSQRT